MNLAIIMNLVWQTKKDTGYVSWIGILHLSFFSALLGPAFTALCGLMYALERHE